MPVVPSLAVLGRTPLNLDQGLVTDAVQDFGPRQNMEDLSWTFQWVCPQFLDLGDAMEWLQTRFHAEILPKIAASVNLGRRMPADARPGGPQGVSDWGDKNNTNMLRLLCPNII